MRRAHTHNITYAINDGCVRAARALWPLSMLLCVGTHGNVHSALAHTMRCVCVATMRQLGARTHSAHAHTGGICDPWPRGCVSPDTQNAAQRVCMNE